jgi:hypothetical protein
MIQHRNIVACAQDRSFTYLQITIQKFIESVQEPTVRYPVRLS